MTLVSERCLYYHAYTFGFVRVDIRNLKGFLDYSWGSIFESQKDWWFYSGVHSASEEHLGFVSSYHKYCFVIWIPNQSYTVATVAVIAIQRVNVKVLIDIEFFTNCYIFAQWNLSADLKAHLKWF